LLSEYVLVQRSFLPENSCYLFPLSDLFWALISLSDY
jgi:hypothetical protein